MNLNIQDINDYLSESNIIDNFISLLSIDVDNDTDNNSLIIYKLSNNIHDLQLDFLLISISDKIPYNFLVPHVRSILNIDRNNLKDDFVNYFKENNLNISDNNSVKNKILDKLIKKEINLDLFVLFSTDKDDPYISMAKDYFGYVIDNDENCINILQMFKNKVDSDKYTKYLNECIDLLKLENDSLIPDDIDYCQNLLEIMSNIDPIYSNLMNHCICYINDIYNE